MKRHYDFLIICGQRSGSHLLGTMLNSHPDIVCHGELFQSRDKILPTRAKILPHQIKGAILMYTKGKNGDEKQATDALENELTCSRVIHLTRNPEDMAKSRLIQARMKGAGQGGAHSLRGKKIKRVELHFPVNEIRDSADVIRAQQEEIRQYLKANNINTLEIEYEKMTKGRDIDSMAYGMAGTLLAFLGIKRHVPLITNLQKTGYSEMVKDV